MDIHTGNDEERPGFGLGLYSIPVQAAGQIALKLSAVSTIMGYGMSGIMGVAGVLVLSGILMTEGVSAEIRVIFGLVLVLYSVYRFMMTRMRSRQAESPEE
jgi:hypothetical protein